jgi:hypothetical protein
LALGFHDLDTLKAIYGHQTEGMLAMCANMAFLRLNSRSTSTWAADLLGTQEVIFPNVQVTRPQQSDSDEEKPAPVAVSISHSTINRHVVSTNQMMELPLTSLASGMIGYFVSHLHPAYRGHIRGTELFPSDSLIAKYSEDKPLLWPPHSEPCFLPRPDADFEVPPNAVPSYAEDEVYSPTHPAGPFDREVDEDEVIEPNRSKEISSDGDEDDFEMRPIRLPPIKRNKQAER